MYKSVIYSALIAFSIFTGNVSAATISGDTTIFQLGEDLSHFGPNAPATQTSHNGSGLALNPLNFSISSTGPRNTLKDTIRIDITAKDGYAIKGVSLLQSGILDLAEEGKAKLKTKLTIQDNSRPEKKYIATKEKSFSASDEDDWSVFLGKDFKKSKYASSISLFITDKLIAKAGKDGRESSLSLLLAELNVKTVAISQPTAVPLLPAVWLMGPGMLGLIAVAKNKRRA